MTHRIRLRSVARVWIAAAAVATGTTLGMAAPALAQADLAARGAALARRVAEVRDGTVRLTFALRPDVCGSGNSIRTNGDRGRISWSDGPNRTRDVEWDDDCESGPGRLALDVRGGAVQAVRFYVGGRWRAADRVTDLGQVPAAQAAGLLLALAERGEGKAARDAIFPTTVVDSVTVWPGLLKIARDDRAEKGVRSQAVFWLGQAAGDAAAQGLAELTDDPEREVRDQAVFALSRRDANEGVPALIRVARTHRDPQTRRSAMFWLGRSNDPRAIALFEELLTKR